MFHHYFPSFGLLSLQKHAFPPSPARQSNSKIQSSTRMCTPQDKDYDNLYFKRQNTYCIISLWPCSALITLQPTNLDQLPDYHNNHPFKGRKAYFYLPVYPSTKRCKLNQSLMGCNQSRQQNRENEILRKGMALLTDKNYKQAQLIFIDFISSYPKDIDKLLELIESAAQMSQQPIQIIKNLKDVFKQSISQENQVIVTFFVAKIFEKYNSLNDAEGWYKKTIRIDPEHQQSRLGLINSLKKLNRYEEILSLLEEMHTNRPDNIQILKEICNYCEQIHKHGKAAQFYQKLIHLQPKNIDNYYSYIHHDSKDDDHHLVKQQQYLTETVNLEKELSFRYYYSEGIVLFMQGYCNNAIEMLLYSISLNELFMPAYHKLAEIYKRMENCEQEKKLLLSLCKLFPYCKKTQNMLAQSYWRNQEYDNAAKIVDKIMQNTSEAAPFDTLMVAKVFYHSGQFEQAENYLLCLIDKCKVRSQAYGIYTQLISMYQLAGDIEKQYHYYKIRNSIKEQLQQKIMFSRICFQLKRSEEYQQLWAQLLAKKDCLSKYYLIVMIYGFYEAQKIDICLQLYETSFIATKKDLKFLGQLQINIIAASCYFMQDKTEELNELQEQIQTLMLNIDLWSVDTLIIYMSLCERLWKMEKLAYLYKIFLQRIAKMGINGYKWGEIYYQPTIIRYRKSLLEEEQRITSTPQ